MTDAIAESRPLAEAEATGAGHVNVHLITPGWGSSGYYSPKVLEQAGRDRVFPAGTQMFINHATESEDWERPAGDLKNLAGVLLEDARWDGKSLSAPAKVFSQWAEPLAEMAPYIGVSIRAAADTSVGEAEGRSGRIIDRITRSESVDFVTKAGRGGSFTVAEAAKIEEARNIGQWLEARLHASFTNIADEMFGDGRMTREERIALSAALGDALGSFVTKVEDAAPQLYQRDLWDDPGAAADVAEGAEMPKQDTPVEESAKTAADVTEDKTITTTPVKEGTQMANIEESRLRALEEAEGRVPVLEQERDKAVAEAADWKQRAHIAEAREYAQEFARKRVTEANKDLPGTVVDRIVAEATREIPLTDELRLNTEKVGEAADKAREAEETYLASIAEDSGFGSVRGVGASAGEVTVSEAEVDTLLGEVFGRTTKGA